MRKLNERSREKLRRTGPFRIWLVWTLATTLGAAMGAWLAVTNFPGAAFGRNPVGEYGSPVFGFAFCLAAPFAVTQMVALLYFMKLADVAKRRKLLWASLWLPITICGIMAMLLPLWAYDVVFWVIPLLWVRPLLPGSLFLGLAQWLLLYRSFRLLGVRFIGGWLWVLLTVFGTAAGSILGMLFLFFGVASGAIYEIEIIWALMTELAIGASQGLVLAAGFVRVRERLG